MFICLICLTGLTINTILNQMTYLIVIMYLLVH